MQSVAVTYLLMSASLLQCASGVIIAKVADDYL